MAKIIKKNKIEIILSISLLISLVMAISFGFLFNDIELVFAGGGSPVISLTSLSVYQSSDVTAGSGGTEVCAGISLTSASECTGTLNHGQTYRFEISAAETANKAFSVSFLDFENAVGSGDVLGTVVAASEYTESMCEAKNGAESIVSSVTARTNGYSGGSACSIKSETSIITFLITIDTDAVDGQATATFNISDGSVTDQSTVTTFNSAPSSNTAPTLTVNQPDGTSDTIAEGANFIVNYDLADSEEIVTANFAYDTDAVGYNGTLIGGCIEQAEGTGATCTWDTTGVTPGDYYVHGTTTDSIAAEVQDYSSGVMTINDAPTITVNEPDGVSDTVIVGNNFTIDYDLADTDDVITANFAYDTDAVGYNGTLIGGCIEQAEGTGVTCTWDTTGVTPGDYYVHGTSTDPYNTEAQDYSSGVVTVVSGTFTTTASSSLSFDVEGIETAFVNQTSTLTKAGALKIEDDRGTNAGWDVNLSSTDWKSGEDVPQLDYDGTGSDDSLGKLCTFPADAAISAESGSITGVSVGSANDCFSSGVTSINVANATNTNGNGTYWLTDMKLEQFIPSNPTAQGYTTTIIYTLISR